MRKEKILLVVDLQPESRVPGKYEKVLHYIRENRKNYDIVVATICVNYPGSSMEQKAGWKECYEPKKLDFESDCTIYKHGYGFDDNDIVCQYVFGDVPGVQKEFDIIGCNTGCCVMAVVFWLFDRNKEINVLTKYCFSTEGEESHEKAVDLMRSNFGSAII